MRMPTWQVHEAKARFSELLRDAADSGPQLVTKHGRPAAVVVSADEYDRAEAPQPSLLDVVQASPMVGVGLGFGRDRSSARAVDLSEVEP